MSKDEVAAYSTDEAYRVGSYLPMHYSRILIELRTITVVQGMLFLGTLVFATSGLVLENRWLVVLFGFALTLVLFVLHWNHYHYFNTLLASVLGLEESNGPWHTYKSARVRYGSLRWLLHHCTSILIALAIGAFVFAT